MLFEQLSGLLVVAVQLLNVDGVHHSVTFCNRRFGKVLTTAQLFQNAGTLVFTFEFFESALDVLALFDRHNNHSGKNFIKFN